MALTAEQNVDEFISEICQRIEGIGPVIANAVAADFSSDLREFLQADHARIAAIKRSSGKPYLVSETILRLIEEREVFINFTDVRDAWCFLIGRNFLAGVVERLGKLRLADVDLNPFLAIGLELKTPEQVLTFNLYQTVTRSVVTSWGTAVEELLIRSGAEKLSGSSSGRSGRRPDIKKIKDDVEYHLQVKSGPNSMNVDMVGSLNEVFQDYRSNSPEIKFILGLTYGTKEMVSPQIRGGVSDFDNCSFVGRDLWDFIGGETDYHLRIFGLLDKASEGILEKPITVMMTAKLSELLDEWKQIYGDANMTEIMCKYV